MKKYSYYLEESQIEQAKSLLYPYEKESDFVRQAIKDLIEHRIYDRNIWEPNEAINKKK
jgi:hypothetical protein